MILNPNKRFLEFLVDPGLWTLPMVTWSCLEFPFALAKTSIFLAWTLTAGLLSKTMYVSCVSQRISILTLLERVFVDTSVLLRCYRAFVIPILKYCFPVWGFAAECHLQLLDRQVYLVARLCPIRFSCRCVIDVMLLHCVCCTRLIRTLIIVCSVSFHLLLPEFDIPSCGCSSFIRIWSIKV